MRIQEYGTSTLPGLLGDTDRVLVHFGTDWCGPCKRLERVLLGLVEKEALGAHLAKVNVEDEPELAQLYSVTKNPTLCYFEHGSLVRSREGFASEEVVLTLMGRDTDN